MTQKQIDYVRSIEDQREQVLHAASGLSGALQANVRQVLFRIEIISRTKDREAETHASVYDAATIASIEAQIQSASDAVDAIFDTGQIAQSRDEMEAEIRKAMDTGTAPGGIPV